MRFLNWLITALESIAESRRLIEDQRISDFRNGRRSIPYYYV